MPILFQSDSSKAQTIRPGEFKFAVLKHMSHSQILVTWNFHTNVDFVPWIGEKTIHWSGVPTVFQNQQVCQDACKTVRNTFQSLVVLQSRGQDPKMYKNKRTNCPLDWKTMRYWNIFFTIFQATGHMGGFTQGGKWPLLNWFSFV